MIRVAVLGSTGSIGGSTLDVLARHPDRFGVVALAARDATSRGLFEQCRAHRPRVAVLPDACCGRASSTRQLRAAGVPTEVLRQRRG